MRIPCGVYFAQNLLPNTCGKGACLTVQSLHPLLPILRHNVPTGTVLVLVGATAGYCTPLASGFYYPACPT